MWFIVLVAVINLFCGYVIASFMGYGPELRLPRLIRKRVATADFEIPVITDDDVQIADERQITID